MGDRARRPGFPRTGRLLISRRGDAEAPAEAQASGNGSGLLPPREEQFGRERHRLRAFSAQRPLAGMGS